MITKYVNVNLKGGIDESKSVQNIDNECDITHTLP